jgi:hypothetical protein
MATLSSKTGLPSFLSTSAQAGEKNYITNPSMVLVSTGWNNVGDLDVARSTTAAELPREYTTATGIKISADSNTQSVADYVYFDFTLDDVDLSKRLKIEWSQKLLGAYTAGQLAVVITTQADRTTALHTPVTTAIPASDGVFTTSFDSSTTATLSLVIRATGDMTTDTGIVISDVVVGPGIITQGAAISSPVSYTPGTSGLGTPTIVSFAYTRLGEKAHIRGRLTTVTASGVASISLPTGLTLGTQEGASALVFGKWWKDDATGGNTKEGSMAGTSGGTTLIFTNNSSASASSPFNTSASGLISSTSVYEVDVIVPIAEWAGNGTVNLGAGAQVEYAYFTGTLDADGSSTGSNSTPGRAGTALGTLTDRRLKYALWQYPPQNGDVISYELSNDNGNSWNETLVTWVDNASSTSTSGIRYVDTTGNVSRFQIGRYRELTTNWVSTTLLRVKKVNPSSPVGFGLVTADSSGLLRGYTSMARIRLHTTNGYGSTNTHIRRFTTAVVNTGSGITYADSSTLGASFTVTEAGIYSFTYSDLFNVNNCYFGLSLNSTQLTTNVVTITAADRLVASGANTAEVVASVSWTGYLAVGDVVRPHADSNVSGTNISRCVFNVQRIA